MSQGNQNRSNRTNRSSGGSGSGGGGNQQRRRRGGSSRPPQPQAPKGPTMTALGESTYEAVLDHGTAGYGVWFDGMVREDPMYKQFWKGTGNRPMYVRIEENRIVLTKELDREQLPVILEDSSQDATSADNDDVQAIDLEADAKKAGAAADTVYSPEEAARLFAGESAGQTDGDAPADAAKADDAEPAAEEPAAAKPKRRTTRKKAAPKAEAKSGDGDAATSDADAGE